MNIPKTLIISGILLIALGLILYFFNNKLNWFGKLPGDISLEKKNFKIYSPLTSMLIISIVISIIFSLIKKIVD